MPTKSSGKRPSSSLIRVRIPTGCFSPPCARPWKANSPTAHMTRSPWQLGLILAAVAAAPAWAEEPQDETVLHEKWQRAYRGIAESIEMRRGETKLALHPTALLYYTNPVRTNGQHGAIYLWTQGGRPAVFGSIWS